MVLHSDVRFSTLVNDLEGEVFDIGLHLRIGEFATNETLRIENTGGRSVFRLIDSDTTVVGNSRVLRVYRGLVLCGVTDMTPGVRKRNVGGGSSVAVVVGEDLNVVILPETDTTVWNGMSARGNEISAGDGLRVGGAQIDADSFAGHYFTGFCGWWSGGMDAGGGSMCISGDCRGSQPPRKVTSKCSTETGSQRPINAKAPTITPIRTAHPLAGSASSPPTLSASLPDGVSNPSSPPPMFPMMLRAEVTAENVVLACGST
jgi:hypothetical protein